MTRRQARAIERSAVADARRRTRAVAVAERAQREHRPSGVRRPIAAGLGLLAAGGILAASLAPVIGTQVAEASQDAQQSVYATAADEAQMFAVSAKAPTLSGLAYAAYEAEVIEPEPEPEPEAQPAGAEAAESDSAQQAPAPVAPPQYTGGGSKEEWMAAAGIAESDWGYVDYIVTRESGWNPNATNPSSGACGLVQALPCSKVPGNGYNPVDNLSWGNGYAVGRYGSWAAAYAFWTANHWW